MGKRQTYRRRSRKRPTRQQRRKTQNRASRRRQRGGVSEVPTIRTIGGEPLIQGAVVATTGGTMNVDTFLQRQQDGGDPSLD